MSNVPEYRSIVSLIPGGVVQFLDFGLTIDAYRGLKLYFREEPTRHLVHLCAWGIDDDESYTVPRLFYF